MCVYIYSFCCGCVCFIWTQCEYEHLRRGTESIFVLLLFVLKILNFFLVYFWPILNYIGGHWNKYWTNQPYMYVYFIQFKSCFCMCVCNRFVLNNFWIRFAFVSSNFINVIAKSIHMIYLSKDNLFFVNSKHVCMCMCVYMCVFVFYMYQRLWWICELEFDSFCHIFGLIRLIYLWLFHSGR